MLLIGILLKHGRAHCHAWHKHHTACSQGKNILPAVLFPLGQPPKQPSKWNMALRNKLEKIIRLLCYKSQNVFVQRLACCAVKSFTLGWVTIFMVIWKGGLKTHFLLSRIRSLERISCMTWAPWIRLSSGRCSVPGIFLFQDLGVNAG